MVHAARSLNKPYLFEARISVSYLVRSIAIVPEPNPQRAVVSDTGLTGRQAEPSFAAEKEQKKR